MLRFAALLVAFGGALLLLASVGRREVDAVDIAIAVALGVAFAFLALLPGGDGKHRRRRRRVERLRARDPYYRLTGRDPAEPPGVLFAVAAGAIAGGIVLLMGNAEWWLVPAVLLGLWLLAELAARRVERRRATA